MIKLIVDLLPISDYYGVSHRIDIAKGRYQIPYTYKGLWEYIKRRLCQKKP